MAEKIQRSLFEAYLARCRHAFFHALVFSFFINILILTVPIYMLQLFDRVIVSHSVYTLVYLTIIALLALIAYGLLDAVRAHLLQGVGRWLDQQLSSQAVTRMFAGGNPDDQHSDRSLLDIGTLRQFFSGQGITTFFDLPWIIIYLVIIYFLSVYLGLLATLAVIVLAVIAYLNELLTRRATITANHYASTANTMVQQSLSKAELIRAQHMLPAIKKQFVETNNHLLSAQKVSAQRNASLLSASKFFRFAFQVLVLGLGAFFVMQGSLSSGGLLAASIILGRALSPIEQSISTWRQFLSMRQAWQRLKEYFNADDVSEGELNYPDVRGVIQAQNVIYLPSGAKKPVLYDINLQVCAGESLAIVGPSGSGKTTLLRLLAGAIVTTDGDIKLDGVRVSDINSEDLADKVGYLAQKNHLFETSIKQNIARMSLVNEEAVIEAAKFTNAHQLFLKLEKHYETIVDDYLLPKGVSRRIAITRTFYQMPQFIFLDCPETNLDPDGLVNLDTIIHQAKERKMTLLVATNSIALAKKMDKVLVLSDGRQQAMGSAQDVLAQH